MYSLVLTSYFLVFAVRDAVAILQFVYSLLLRHPSLCLVARGVTIAE